MDITILVDRKKTANRQKLTELQTRRAELRFVIANNERSIAVSLKINPHHPNVPLYRSRVKQAEAELAEVEKQITAIKEYKYPTLEQLRWVDQLHRKVISIEWGISLAERAAFMSDAIERPKAAAAARQRKAEIEAGKPKAREELSAALVKVGFAPDAL